MIRRWRSLGDLFFSLGENEAKMARNLADALPLSRKLGMLGGFELHVMAGE